MAYYFTFNSIVMIVKSFAIGAFALFGWTPVVDAVDNPGEEVQECPAALDVVELSADDAEALWCEYERGGRVMTCWLCNCSKMNKQ